MGNLCVPEKDDFDTEKTELGVYAFKKEVKIILI